MIQLYYHKLKKTDLFYNHQKYKLKKKIKATLNALKS